MKLSRIFRGSHSMATRLTWRVIGTMIVMLMLILSLILLFLYIVGLAGLSMVFIATMQVSCEKIFNGLSQVEVAVKNNVPEVVENLDNRNRQYYSVEHLLKLNPNIIGSAVALNPDAEPLKGEESAAYAYRDSTGKIHTMQLNSKRYDYIHKEWYMNPVKEQKGVWSDPYVDTGGGEVPMVTFSLPLIDSTGTVYAVHTADLALDWVNDLRVQMEQNLLESSLLGSFSSFSEDSIFSFIVTEDGTIVSHPDKNLVMKTRYQDVYKFDGGHLSAGYDNAMMLYTDSLNRDYMVFDNQAENSRWRMITFMPLDYFATPLLYFLNFLVVIILVGLVIVALACRSAIRRITRPLSSFADSADEIAKGNFQAELPQIRTKDEMQRLRNSFELMQSSLVRQIRETREINEEKGRMEGELLAARNIQMSMLPKTFPPYPDRNDVDIYAQLTPAKEVGGDLFDFYIRDEKLLFCVGDVSGKGIPASLVMAVTRSLFRSVSAHESQPSRIMTAINSAMVEGNESEMFVTLFIGVLDLPTGRLRYCNAGHNAPLLLRPEGTDWLPCDPNLPIGIMDELKFTGQETLIAPQTLLFLYTDGLTEAETVSHQQFQEERVLQVARQSQLQPQTLIEEMTGAVHHFVEHAEQNDDMTMLAVLYCRKQETIRLQRTLTLTNNIDEVPQLSAFVEAVGEALSMDASVTMQINLAIEEAVVNVMSYAYPGGISGMVSITAQASDEQVQFVITDNGIPFDPTRKDAADTTLSVEERPIGGLGIHLIRQMMDSINYERIDGKNILTLTKKLDGIPTHNNN